MITSPDLAEELINGYRDCDESEIEAFAEAGGHAYWLRAKTGQYVLDILETMEKVCTRTAKAQ